MPSSDLPALQCIEITVRQIGIELSAVPRNFSCRLDDSPKLCYYKKHAKHAAVAASLRAACGRVSAGAASAAVCVQRRRSRQGAHRAPQTEELADTRDCRLALCNRIRRCGGIGRHQGLKIPWSQDRTGSSPVSGTIKGRNYDTIS